MAINSGETAETTIVAFIRIYTDFLSFRCELALPATLIAWT